MELSERLKTMRESKRLSVSALADSSGVSVPYIRQIESGRRKNPSGDKLQRLATALGSTITDLLDSREGISADVLEDVPPSLKAFVDARKKKHDLRREDVEMLKRIHYRGRRPGSVEDWELIYLFLKRILDT